MTADIRPTLGQRLKAAGRLMFRTGDDGTVCSFCAKSRWDFTTDRDVIVAGPGVAICWECAQLVCDLASQSKTGAAPDGQPLPSTGPTTVRDDDGDAAKDGDRAQR